MDSFTSFYFLVKMLVALTTTPWGLVQDKVGTTTIYGSFTTTFRLYYDVCLCLHNRTYYISSGTVFWGELNGGHYISQQLPFLEGEQYYTLSGTVFQWELNGGHYISLQLSFLEGEGYYQGPFVEESWMVATTLVSNYLFFGRWRVLYIIRGYFLSTI